MSIRTCMLRYAIHIDAIKVKIKIVKIEISIKKINKNIILKYF